MQMNKLYLAILFLLNSIFSIGQIESDPKIDSSPVLYEVLPQAKFPGGQDSLFTFLVQNLKWPSPQFCGEGSVIIKFNVQETGEITDKKIIRGLCKECDKEALRIIDLMPNWIPPKKNGKPVKTIITFPIKFKLE